MMKNFPNWILRRRVWILLATLLVVVVTSMGMGNLVFSSDYRIYFSDDNPQLKAFELTQKTYTKTDNVLIAIAPPDGNVMTPGVLSAVEWLTKKGWTLPYASRVDSLTNFQHTAARGDELVVRDLVSDAAALTPARLEQLKEIVLSEPLLARQLISAQLDVTAVNVTFDLPGKDLTEVSKVMQAARALIDEFNGRFPGLQVRVTGAIPMDNAFAEQSVHDLSTLTPIMYGVIVLVTFLVLRSISGVLGAVLIVTFSTLIAMGLTGWFGITLTPPTASAPTVVLTLAIAHGIHVLVTVINGMRRGLSKHEAITESIRINLYPITLATVTDVIGFLSMNASEVPPFRDLGNVVTLGVLAAYLLSIFFLPALLAVLPLHVRPTRGRTGMAMDRLADFVIRRRTPLLVGMSVVAIGLVSLTARNELNDNFVKYFDESVEFRRDTDFINNKLAGIDGIFYSVPAGESGGVSNPEYLAKLDEFANWYRTQPGVVHVVSIADVMKRLNKNMHGDNPAWYRIPDSRALAAQYLLLYEMSLPFGLDLNSQINVDKSATLMSVVMKSSTTKDLLALEDRAQQWLAQNAPPSMQTPGTGPRIMFAHIGQRNIESMINGSIVSLLLISVVLMVVLRSFKLGILSVAPNLLPAAMAFGIWGVFVGQVGVALTIVAAMTYGIVVDDTIHSMSKYVQARREKGLSAEAAVRYVFSNVGMASWAMSIILMSGFGVLALSAFELNAGMGIMTALIIALALIAEFFLLPPLLMAFDRRSYAKHEKDVGVIAVAGAKPERV